MNPLLSPAAALGSAATLGIADFTGGVAGRRTPPASVGFGIEIVGLAALPLALWLLPVRWVPLSALLAFAGGAIGGVGLVLFYRAMALNLIGVVAPVSAVVAASLPTAVGLLSGDRLHLTQFAGIAAGLLAIGLINLSPQVKARDARAALRLAIAAGIGFGLFFILVHAASSAGVTALIFGRAGSALSAVCFALVTGVSFVPRRQTWHLVGVAGSFDGVGVILYLYATFHGLLSLSALLTSFYPAFTVLCARLLTRERMSPIQALGAGLAVAAVALIAAT
ncbi:MAG TPA: EamA family transporter [Candidatus Dormibacteraeota bacterium]